MKRDKKIEVRVTPMELLQIKRHFGDGELSKHVRDYLLELTKECKVDVTDEVDMYELFKAFLSEDKTSRDIFTKFVRENDLGSFEDVTDSKETDETLVWYQGKKITYTELKRIEDEFNK